MSDTPRFDFLRMALIRIQPLVDEVNPIPEFQVLYLLDRGP